MEEECFESIDEPTEQGVRQRELEEGLRRMGERCSELSECLRKEREHIKEVSHISNFFDEKLGQMSQLLIDFLALQNYIMKQVESMDDIGVGVKGVVNDLNGQIEGMKGDRAQSESRSKQLMGEWERKLKELSQSSKEQYQQIIRAKDSEINTLKLSLETLSSAKEEQRKMFDLVLKKVTAIESGVYNLNDQKGSDTRYLSQIKALENKCTQHQEEIGRLNEEIMGLRSFGLLSKPDKLKPDGKLMTKVESTRQGYKPLPEHPIPPINWVSQNLQKYPKNPRSKIQLGTSETQGRTIMNEMEKVFCFAVQNATNVISKSSNELMSQLAEKDSWERMSSEKNETKMSLEEIKKKLSSIDSSSKKAIEALITEVKHSIKDLLADQYPPQPHPPSRN